MIDRNDTDVIRPEFSTMFDCVLILFPTKIHIKNNSQILRTTSNHRFETKLAK